MTTDAAIDQEWLAREFPLDEALVYLNHAAVAPWPARTAAAVQAFAEENMRFGASQYPVWLDTEAQLRERLARFIHAASVDDIALVKNTSEALSMVAGGLDWRFGDNVVSSNQEFPSNRIPWQAQQQYGVEFRQVDLFADATPEAALIDACDDRTRVLTISSVQYGSGLKLNLEKLGQHCRTNNIIFCVDAIQSLGVHRIDVQSIHADFIMADAHKWLLGPEGIAVFYSSPQRRYELKLHEYGWHMVQQAGDYDQKEWRPAASAKRFECGSPNMLGIYAFAASLSLFEEVGMESIEQQIQHVSNYLLDSLRQINALEFISPLETDRRGGIVNFRINGLPGKRLHAELMQANVICANRAGGVRLSPHFYTPEKKIDQAVEIIKSLCS